MTTRPGRHIVRAMRYRLLRPFEGTGLYPVAAVLLMLIGTCFLVSNLLSSSAILWTGKAVKAREDGGIVYYQYRSQTYSLNDPNSYGSGARTVYLDPSNPNRAMLYTTASRVFDVVTVGGPYAAAAGFFAAGFVYRGRTRRRLTAEREEPGSQTFGQGLDSEVIAQVVARRKTAELARRMAIRRTE